MTQIEAFLKNIETWITANPVVASRIGFFLAGVVVGLVI
jgi:hypothetical protein